MSRHHALILAGTREAIIEDLNSTNGVILNGRKVSRQVLNDGDILTIGDIQFRYVAKPAQPAPHKGDFRPSLATFALLAPTNPVSFAPLRARLAQR